jgi:hypothetical protein
MQLSERRRLVRVGLDVYDMHNICIDNGSRRRRAAIDRKWIVSQVPLELRCVPHSRKPMKSAISLNRDATRLGRT